MPEMKELIQRLRTLADIGPGTGPTERLLTEAADALERLTAGDVEFPSHPEPMIMRWTRLETDAIIDYGNRRAAAAVLAERESNAEVLDEMIDVVNLMYAKETDKNIRGQQAAVGTMLMRARDAIRWAKP